MRISGAALHRMLVHPDATQQRSNERTAMLADLDRADAEGLREVLVPIMEPGSELLLLKCH